MTTKEIGDPITTAQACWAILKLINSPIVGHIDANSSVGSALQHCFKVFPMLSRGEQRLVRIAQSLHTGDEDLGGVACLSGLDRDTRRKVWLIIGYLILGHDLVWSAENVKLIDWSGLREQ